VQDPDFELGVQRYALTRAIGQVQEDVAGGLYGDEYRRRGGREPDVFAGAIREYYSTLKRSKKEPHIKLTEEQFLIHHPNGVSMSSSIRRRH
jgi:hypothetical protein